MLLARFQFGRRISWKLNKDDPSLFALPDAKEWALLAPLLYPQLPIPAANSDILFDAIAPGKYFIMSKEVVLATHNDQIIEEFKRDKADVHKDLPLNLREILEKLILRLRHAGGQATIPNYKSLMCTFAEISALPVFDPSAFPLRPSTVNEYWWKTAITGEHLRALGSSGAKLIPPTHDMLFLDAVAAYREGDFRRTMLYAAMSTEIAFGAVIDNAYEHILTAPEDDRFRVIQRSLAGGAVASKDPVYDHLRRHIEFGVMINELALYVLRRSLLIENETLYQKAKRLHSTRNKLAHAGAVDEPESNATFALDESGSMEALETALALFSWLGERADFPLPKSAFVKIAGADSTTS
jgi:hypothetical protein